MPEVVIYTTTYCGYCHAAKRLLKSRGVEFEEINLTTDPEGRAELVTRAQGRRTVPQIFIKGDGIGGYTELRALDVSGQLEQLLAA